MNRGLLWSARDRDEFIAQIENWDTPVPDCRGDQKPEHLENWALRRSLSALTDTGFIAYPFSLCKSESPDFVAISGAEKIGIEITEMISENWALLYKYARSNEIIDSSLPCLKIGSPRLRKEEISKVLNNKLTGLGWTRNEQEEGLKNDVKISIMKKQKKLEKNYSNDFSNNALIIYDDQWLVNIEVRQKSMQDIQNWYYSKNFVRYFDNIIILRDMYLFHLSVRGAEHREIALLK